MKIFFTLLLLGLAACAGQKSTETTHQEDLVRVALFQGEGDKLWVRVPAESLLVPGQNESQHSLFIGTLGQNSTLQLKDQSLMMTTISMQEAVAPESGYLNIPDSQIGKSAIVRGHWAGDLYQAEIVCVFDNPPTRAQISAYEQGTKNILKACH